MEDVDDLFGPLVHLFDHPALHQSNVSVVGVDDAHAAKHTRPQVVLQGQVIALRNQALYLDLSAFAPFELTAMFANYVKKGQPGSRLVEVWVKSELVDQDLIHEPIEV